VKDFGLSGMPATRIDSNFGATFYFRNPMKEHKIGTTQACRKLHSGPGTFSTSRYN